MGNPLPEAPLMELALAMGVYPHVIETEWDAYWVNRLLSYIEAKAMARGLK